MKRFQLFILAVSLILLPGCSKTENKPSHENQAPVCQITFPSKDSRHALRDTLEIRGSASDPDNNISSVRLFINGKQTEEIRDSSFTSRILPKDLTVGEMTIRLVVSDTEGLQAECSVTIHIVEDQMILSTEDGTRELSFGYWTEEAKIRIETNEKWTLLLPEGSWFSIYNPSAKKWVSKGSIAGKGPSMMTLKSIANSTYEDREAQLSIRTAETIDNHFKIRQKASPNLFESCEDKNFRIAVELSASLYEMDANEDGKMSAFEAERAPKAGVPYGIEAGGFDIKSIQGIENFPQIRHLVISDNADLTEVDLTRNTHLMSLHTQNLPNLKSLEIGHLEELIELGCDFRIFNQVYPDVVKRKEYYNTLGILNRKDGEPSKLNLEGFKRLERLYINNDGFEEVNIKGCTELWRFVATGNNFEEIDLSEVDRKQRANQYLMVECPNLKRIYVWKGFTLDYYDIFRFDDRKDIQIIEK